MNKEPEAFESRVELSGLRAAVERIKGEIHKMLVGQEAMVEYLLAAVLADGHVLLEGVPGIAKTLTAKLLARTVSADFSRIQFTPDLMPSDVLGTTVFNTKTSEFEFNRGPIFANLVLIDEINRAPAKTQSALFEVMEERQVTVDGVTYPMARPFIVVATQNPIEQEGTYRLPEAQIDRFLFKLDIGYPSLDEESQILTEFSRTSPADLSRVGPVVSGEEIVDYQQKARGLHVEANLIRYVTGLVHQTRHHPGLYLGGSPRASLAVMVGAKALAAMQGRDFVTPEDVQRVAYPALRHRLLLTPEREMEGDRPEDIIKQILERVEVPR